MGTPMHHRGSNHIALPSLDESTLPDLNRLLSLPTRASRYPQGNFDLFFIAYSWDMLARGNATKTPFVTHRSGHFVTRRLLSLPTRASIYPQGYFGLFFIDYSWNMLARGNATEMPFVAR